MSAFGDFRKKFVEKLADNLAGVIITVLLTAGPWLLRQIPLLKPYLQLSVPIWWLLSVSLPLLTIIILLYRRQRSSAQKGTLRIAPKSEGNCWWSPGNIGDNPAMQIVGRMFVTNTHSAAIRITHAELRYGFGGRKRVSAMGVSVSRSLRENLYGMFDISPNETTNLSFDFWILPPVVKPTEPFTAHSVTIFDHLGNAHTLRTVCFESMKAKIPDRPKEPEEFPYEIKDPIEKEVVSVLKAEVGRYQMCGRLTGGLGSVHIVYNGHAFTGVGSDSWTPTSPANQLNVADPEAAALKSDNLDALVGFYERLPSNEEKDRFAKALLDRLDSKRGYLSVSYFIVCVLWRTGRLTEALEKAKRDLPENEQKVFGLSNVLMLLNGLLKYRHPDFSNQMLDDVEHLTHGLAEHTFLIPAKIAAIRASRLGLGRS
jgi:hypothetical protein